MFAEDDEDGERSSLLWLGQKAGGAEKKVKLVKALFYAVQVFYSFFIMWVVPHLPGDLILVAWPGTDLGRLLFMTYNGWVMLAVAVGAFVGYLAFGESSATKSVACH